MTDPRAYLVVALGAAIGGVLRYAINIWFFQRLGPGFPYATLVINISGSFLIGAVIELAHARAITPLVRTALAVGLLGGYTTFSSFSYEMLALEGEGFWAQSVAYALGSVVFGVLACQAGILAARLIARSG